MPYFFHISTLGKSYFAVEQEKNFSFHEAASTCMEATYMKAPHLLAPPVYIALQQHDCRPDEACIESKKNTHLCTTYYVI